MSPKPSPLTLSNSITDRLEKLYEVAGHFAPVDPFIENGLRRDIDRLAALHIGLASLSRTSLETLTGNFDAVRQTIQNARANQEHLIADSIEVTFYSNLVDSVPALELLRRRADYMPFERPLHEFVRALTALGFFRFATQAMEAAQRKNLVTNATETMIQARECASALDLRGISDDEIARMTSEVGKILVGRGLLWMDRGPAVTLNADDPRCPQILLQYKVDVSPDEAAHLSWTLTERLYDAGLRSDALQFAFLGVATAITPHGLLEAATA